VIGKLIPTYNGFPSVYITGPGSYEGKKLDGSTGYNLEPNINNKFSQEFLELKGNLEMGAFRIIEFNTREDQPVDKTTTTSAATQTTTNTPENEGGGVLKPIVKEWPSSDIDTAHAVKPFLTETQKGLEEMWKNGKNPIVENIKMTITKASGGSFKTRVTADIVESKDGKAWVGIDSRGSAGRGYVERADDQYMGGRYNEKGEPVLDGDGNQVNKGQAKTKSDGSANPCYGKSLIECMKLPQVGGDDVKLAATIEDANFPFKQYFVIFTKPGKFPPR
jgi:hypothetical protein